MGNKYYKPEIEEFHQGFEFQIFEQGYDGVEDYWRSEVFKNYDSPLSVLGTDYQNIIRVKILDREDLESLGWNQTDYDTFRLGILEVYLEFNPEYKTFIYESKYAPNVKENLFKGTIKNKSELQKLMKMLNIQ